LTRQFTGQAAVRVGDSTTEPSMPPKKWKCGPDLDDLPAVGTASTGMSPFTGLVHTIGLFVIPRRVEGGEMTRRPE
jgi:hypothetical protein